ncbi:uncharacterized protein LOC122851247 isoform X1 [Aphidius gifuensis]|uniref:uncharacterized protein LOC122851247 isoform X1 n=1 Tax=Aphidius gifuensis TaxID=684658 RepID=UPI001CDD3369|nr:uncharacterized protein LOC122851247 isoform X1 [Aphidius gifuensis]XP_044006294.1 uncharacterized protein LOC122851247 isoform X1 [Aphidius gifuensis]
MAISDLILKFFICLFFIFLTFFLVEVKAQNKTLKDLFNSSSCARPPYTCPHPQIEFYLYTRTTQKKPALIDVKNYRSLDYTTFNNSHPTKIIIHGFGGGRNLAPSTDLRNAFFKRGDYNIIIVDYGTLVREPCLSQMQWGPDFCSRCIAQLVRYLKHHPRGIQVENIHVLGYSVGAHIAGLIANYLPDDKLGRITDYNYRSRSNDIFLHEWKQIEGFGRDRCKFCRCDPYWSWNTGSMGTKWTRRFLCKRWIESTGMRNSINTTDTVLRSHESNTILHRVDNVQGRILGSTMSKSLLIPHRMVQPRSPRVDTDGRGYSTYRTRSILSVNKRTQTIRPRTTRKKSSPEKTEAIVLPPVLSLLKQLINIILE